MPKLGVHLGEEVGHQLEFSLDSFDTEGGERTVYSSIVIRSTSSSLMSSKAISTPATAPMINRGSISGVLINEKRSRERPTCKDLIAGAGAFFLVRCHL